MDQKEEFERSEPKGDFPPKEPVEPFFEGELFEPSRTPKAPSVKGLHVPKEGVTKEDLETFLIELKPIVADMDKLTREDQHLIASILQEVKNKMHASGDFSEEETHLFEHITAHFSELLTRGASLDKEKALNAIRTLQDNC
ncbi:MAG: hypothetical protein KR126chlam1_00882 [Chlamydiae bacterium]|nr:hypothetical protein [Chlamydiota bacterium]